MIARVTDLIELVGGVDGILQAAGARRCRLLRRRRRAAVLEARQGRSATTFLKAYRWQYIVSGVQDGRFSAMLTSHDHAARRPSGSVARSRR